MAEYKIKDLEQLTGIKAHTIRMWEKRYGILQPERTETHFRTYKDHELVFLLNVALLNKNGMKISHIAALQPSEISQKVIEYRIDSPIETSHEKLLLALVELDEILFKETLNELILKCGLEVTFISHLLPFLEKIGVMWMVGTINPAQEHFMSNLIRQKIIAETDKLPIPDPNGQRIMLFLPEHEWHEISLLFYHFILRKGGKCSFYMGQSLPYNALLESIQRIKPAFLITSWLTAVDAGFMKQYFKRLNEDTNKIPVYAGGYQIKINAESIENWAIHIESIESIRNL